MLYQDIKEGSIIQTDMWKGYLGLEKLGFSHGMVNHSENFKDPNTGIHTNTIEGTRNGLTLVIPPRNRNKKSINEHLIEFIWRRKNKKDLWNGFLNALKTTAYK
jgi:hypothetical protein